MRKVVGTFFWHLQEGVRQKWLAPFQKWLAPLGEDGVRQKWLAPLGEEGVRQKWLAPGWQLDQA
jgi:hypothetical protein